MPLLMSSISVQFSSVVQSCPTLQPHELQHARPPCPLPTPIHLATGKCFTFTGLALMFCSVPISTASLLELAFIFAGIQNFTWLSWGTLTALLSHSLCRQDCSYSRRPPGTQEWHHIDATLLIWHIQNIQLQEGTQEKGRAITPHVEQGPTCSANS